MLSKEEISQLKEQLKAQISHLPPDKKSSALQQIDSMSPEALEGLVEEQKSSGKQNPFRQIVSGQIPSVKIDENPAALAVLDINPISKGHTLIILKNPITNPKEIPKSAFDLAKSISDKIMENLKAKEVRMETDNSLGEAIIHLIPIYNQPLTKDSPRSKSTKDNLEEIKLSINTEKIEKKIEKIKVPKVQKKRALKINKRIP